MGSGLRAVGAACLALSRTPLTSPWLQVPQKGIHMIARAIRRANERDAQFVLLGTGHADGDFKNMAEHEFGPNHNR